MKTAIIETNHAETDGGFSWYLISDSAVSNSGKPFYIPEGNPKVEAFLAPVVRINRLGKSISPKFAHRYYSEIAPAIHFRLPELRDKLMRLGLSADPSQSFDRSLIIGEFSPISFEEGSVMRLHLNGENKAEWSSRNKQELLDRILSEISKMNTVKMGDFLIPELSEAVEVTIGDILEVKASGQPTLTVKVK